jgi:hypothetical protein
MANKLQIDGMHLDGKKLGFRLRIGRSYLVFLLLVHIFIIPGAVLTHSLFIHLNCHVSILVAIFFTAVIFISFGLFKEWLEDEISIKLIKKAWNMHFSYFPYDEYHLKVNEIYNKAILEDIPKNDLEKYIFDHLVE